MFGYSALFDLALGFGKIAVVECKSTLLCYKFQELEPTKVTIFISRWIRNVYKHTQSREAP